jgi:hypothetical protein
MSESCPSIGYLRRRHAVVTGTHLLRGEMKDLGWTDMAQDRDRWRALVSAVTNLRIHKMQGIFRTADDLLASHKGLCSMELVS